MCQLERYQIRYYPRDHLTVPKCFGWPIFLLTAVTGTSECLRLFMYRRGSQMPHWWITIPSWNYQMTRQHLLTWDMVSIRLTLISSVLYLWYTVYYLVYTENGALLSKNPIQSHNPHLGRIWAKQVTPPHTVASLKQCICKVEGIPQGACIRAQLFATMLSESALSDGAVSILASGGLGSTPDDPIALHLIAKDLTYTVAVQARWTWGKQTITVDMHF